MKRIVALSRSVGVIPRAGRPSRAPSIRRSSSLIGLGVVALAGVAVTMTALVGPWEPQYVGPTYETTPPRVMPSAAPTAPLDVAPPAFRLPDVAWLLLALAVVALVLMLWQALIVLLSLVRRLGWLLPRHGRDAATGDAVTLEDMVEGLETPDIQTMRVGIDGAQDHLRRRAKPADAVVAAWQAIEAAAERSGVIRHPAATPTEFTISILKRTPADPAATHALLKLYLRARFGDEPLSSEDLRAAVGAAATLASDLRRIPSDRQVSDPTARLHGAGSTR